MSVCLTTQWHCTWYVWCLTHQLDQVRSDASLAQERRIERAMKEGKRRFTLFANEHSSDVRRA